MIPTAPYRLAGMEGPTSTSGPRKTILPRPHSSRSLLTLPGPPPSAAPHPGDPGEGSSHRLGPPHSRRSRRHRCAPPLRTGDRTAEAQRAGGPEALPGEEAPQPQELEGKASDSHRRVKGGARAVPQDTGKKRPTVSETHRGYGRQVRYARHASCQVLAKTLTGTQEQRKQHGSLKISKSHTRG